MTEQMEGGQRPVDARNAEVLSQMIFKLVSALCCVSVSADPRARVAMAGIGAHFV